MFSLEHTGEIDRESDLVVDLVEAVRETWRGEADAFPGDPDDHNGSRELYSDHRPVVFRLRSGGDDD